MESPGMTQQSLTEHLATDEHPFHFQDSGLDNVYLVGIKYFTHPDGRIVAEIPALKQLMRLIARDLVLSKSDLTGSEVRFLRKRLGKKATEYCKYLGLEPETLSRIENGKQPISSATEKLARLSYAILCEESGLYDHARTILQSMLDESKPVKDNIVLEIQDNNEWREAA
jgi:transcriptional regulator with XRE-family HTH domain